jgi:putative Mg2+ transporter-C (MgtC) family protein
LTIKSKKAKGSLMDFQELVSITPFNWGAVGTSLLCGTIIGLERQLRGKPVGIRTSALITLGTYIYIAITSSVSNGATDRALLVRSLPESVF